MTQTFSLNTVVVAAQQQVSADFKGEEVILNLETGIYHGLNEVGARIWSLLEQPRTVADIQEVILAEYEVEPGRCLQDIVRLLGELHEAKLIETRED